ncbi:MAG: aromatic ring-hydroxylating dioxygenase subunit alpha [Bdellovibrionaceae bacterium]|nr:aromatic ring-hydroxylating dioxygenase subunit alpha [Pseudobdellovibrionaceae bacterium]
MRSLKELTQKTLEHIENKTLELGDRIRTISTESYLSITRYDSEVRYVIKKKPLPFCPSNRLKNRGDFFVSQLSGLSLLAIRGEDGQVRIFLNMCRHRGARFVSEDSGSNCKKIVCPYHGWTYSDQGKLSPISTELGLKSQSENVLRLLEYPCHEFFGMIWVILDRGTDADKLAVAFKFFENDQDELGIALEHALPEHSFIGKFNWKLGVEAFLEVYHFAYAHAPYLAQLSYPNLSLSDNFDENVRTIVPLKKPNENAEVLSWAQLMYFIFPSTFLLYYNDHAALISLTPVSIQETRVSYIPLVPQKALEDLRDIEKKVDFLKVIISQDVTVLENVQLGLGSPENSQFIFTRLESQLPLFHHNIEKALGSKVDLKYK